MKNTLCTIAVFILALPAPQLHSQTLEWVRFAGGTNFDSGSSITTDPDGNAYAVMRGTYPFTAGDIVIPNADPGNNADAPLVIVRYQPDGQVDWVGRALDGAQPESTTLAWHPSGALLAAGSFTRTMTWVNPGPNPTNITLEAAGDWNPFSLPADIFLLKLDADGNLLWTTNYGGLDNQTCSGMALDSTGNALLGGMFKKEIQLGHIHADSAGLGGYELGQWVAKLDTNGTPIWLNTILSSNTVGWKVKIAVDAQDNVFVASPFLIDAIVSGSNLVSRGEMDLLLAKYNPAGQLLWVRQAGSSGYDELGSLAADPSGNVYVCGVFRPAVGGAPGAWFDDTPFQSGPFLAKYDPAGNLVWVKSEEASELTIGPEGSLYGAGLINLSRTVGGTSYSANGYYDILAARWDADGNAIWSGAIADREVDTPTGLAVDLNGAVWVAGNSMHEQRQTTYGTPFFGLQDVVIGRFATAGPAFTSQPLNQLVQVGKSVQFEAALTNAQSPELQWLRNGQPLAEGPRFTGVHSNRLTITSVELADEGEYVLRVRAANGSALSAAARLRIEGLMQFKSIESLEGGGFRLDFEGLDGRLYNIEASEDLLRWSFLTNGFCRDGLLTVTDRSGSTNRQRLFRAVAN